MPTPARLIDAIEPISLSSGQTELENMTIAETELIAIARKIVGDFACSADVRAGGVAAALVTASGDVFTGICIDTACSMGHCAESSAISEMLKTRQTQIARIVAVDESGQILPPCGRCRELIRQVSSENWMTQVIVASDRSVSLSDMMPFSGPAEPVSSASEIYRGSDRPS